MYPYITIFIDRNAILISSKKHINLKLAVASYVNPTLSTEVSVLNYFHLKLKFATEPMDTVLKNAFIFPFSANKILAIFVSTSDMCTSNNPMEEESICKQLERKVIAIRDFYLFYPHHAIYMYLPQFLSHICYHAF
jgi:hypothetical protein